MVDVGPLGAIDERGRLRARHCRSHLLLPYRYRSRAVRVVVHVRPRGRLLALRFLSLTWRAASVVQVLDQDDHERPDPSGGRLHLRRRHVRDD